MAKPYKKNIIIIAPHADDEIIGCGGAIAKHIAEKDSVKIIICTNANIGAPKKYTKKYIDNVRNEALAAHKVLGKIETFFLDFPAPLLDTYPNYLIADKLTSILKKNKPHIVYIPFVGDLHNDHKMIYDACLVACRTSNTFSIEKVLSYEVLSETECSSTLNNIHFKPNFFVDISKFIKIKINAFKKYKSQIKNFPDSRSIKGIESSSIYRGSTLNLK